LYEIDRIVSRSIAYVVVSAVLLAVFGAAILMLSAALSSVAGGKSIAVAASTLVAYAACQPVLGRVRRTVDRRFDRARYDGERTATVFAARVRDETDVKAVIDDLAATSRSVVAPISLTVWLRPRDMPR
jgi:membrane protein implicated in regulation of membrane protease activity